MLTAPSFMIAEELGQRVLEAVDQLDKFAPDMRATFDMELDDVKFQIIVRLADKEDTAS